MDDAAKFWAQVQKSEGCWEWTGLLANGYGRFAPRRGLDVKAHRYAWTQERGPIPRGKVLCHSCDNRRCVRTDHMFVGTQRDNLLDASRKGRLPNQRKTHCARGHALVGDNVRQRYGRAGRQCVTCARAFNRESKRRAKQAS